MGQIGGESIEPTKLSLAMKCVNRMKTAEEVKMTLVCSLKWERDDDITALTGTGMEQGIWREACLCSCIFS